eukprot:CAMPEP_0178385284 /NCGR_PEP_ID=MMETSP0689_2-20121128/7955_1 /TAXON_ID=160604 /ORGANISM="Amphidinium massartii, Strain CS-259" /LENGTH=324 /DNA_ID=CAMNT_0020005565 /DNA_START=123 /DNA_END=1093 /DNA_ORIENTATION=-
MHGPVRLCHHRRLSTAASADSSSSEEKAEPWTAYSVSMAALGVASGCTFLFYFHKAGYSLHRTELLMLEQLGRLPLYPPPHLPEAETNSALETDALPAAFVEAFADWFIATDLKQGEGVTRDDVLELFSDLGFAETDKACKTFINEGEGSFEEARRLSGAGLQESLSLLEDLCIPMERREKVSGSAKGEMVRARIGAHEIELVKQRLASVQAVTIAAAAAAMQEAAEVKWSSSMSPSDHSGSAPSSAGAPEAAMNAPLPPFAPIAGPAHDKDCQCHPGTSPADTESNVSTFASTPVVEALDDKDAQRMELARLARIEEGLLAQL